MKKLWIGMAVTGLLAAAGPVSAQSGAALQGDWGAEIDISDLRSNGGQAVLITEEASYEKNFGALFRVDFSALVLDQGDRVELIRASEGPSLGTGMILRLLVRDSGGGLQIRLRARDAHDTWRSTAWSPISSQLHHLAVRWQAGEGDGFAGLWIDGLEAARLTGLANADQGVGVLGVGVLNPLLAPHHGDLPESLIRLDEVTFFR